MALPLIAHVLYRLDYGGLENGLVNLLNRLPGEAYGHTVICMTEFTGFRKRIERPDITVHALGKRPGQDPRAYLRLAGLLRELRPAVLHSRNVGVLDCSLVAALAGVPVRIHGYHGWDVDDLHGRRLKRRVFRRTLHPFVDRFVAVSRDIEHWLVTSEGVAPGRVTQIYNGVDTDRFRPPDHLRGADDPLLIGSVGRLQAVKNHVLLVDACADLLARRPDLRGRFEVSLVGDGPERSAVEARIGERGLGGIVRVAGFSDDVASRLRAFDVFVLPSLNEGISNTILEAMASGLPVVATRVGGNVELVDDGVTGTLVAPDDAAPMAAALERYVDDPDARRSHGRQARAIAEQRFSLDAMTRAYDQLYRDHVSAAAGR